MINQNIVYIFECIILCTPALHWSHENVAKKILPWSTNWEKPESNIKQTIRVDNLLERTRKIRDNTLICHANLYSIHVIDTDRAVTN